MTKDKTKYNEIEPKMPKDDDISHEESVTEEHVKVEQITSQLVTKRKKGLMERLVIGIAGPDGIRSIGGYVNREIIVPAIKNIIADSITSGINMMMFGEGGRYGSGTGGRHAGPSGYSSRPPAQRTNYTNRYSPTPYTQEPERPVVRGGVDEYIISNRNEAMDVLNQLRVNAQEYGVVSIADYYDMIGVETTYTDNTYGWDLSDLQHVSLRPMRRGFVIGFPPVRKL